MSSGYEYLKYILKADFWLIEQIDNLTGMRFIPIPMKNQKIKIQINIDDNSF